ncbi:DUF6292 family protein [Amycolatopsis taiwanensis]|uniref:DUF6292 family protein n=1 Tax=Amycolatopsis taiwanensis TaxID=342230 RepID=UPI001FE1B3D3|nr:DUF6292 family protein [Amycolatopsis taiwanensis]
MPPEATSFEVSDTATAYLGLARRWSARPVDDLMLVWSERHGWAGCGGDRARRGAGGIGLLRGCGDRPGTDCGGPGSSPPSSPGVCSAHPDPSSLPAPGATNLPYVSPDTPDLFRRHHQRCDAMA